MQVLYMMLTGVSPFVGENEGETRRKMAAGVYPPEPLQRCSPLASDLVSCLWSAVCARPACSLRSRSSPLSPLRSLQSAA